MAEAYSPAAKLVGAALDKLHKDPQVERIVLRNKKLGLTAISYHGDKEDGTIITILKTEEI